MGLDATVDRNPKHLPDHLRERVIVDSASGVMDLRDPADDRIFGKAKREAWQKITAAARSREPAHFISQMPSLIRDLHPYAASSEIHRVTGPHVCGSKACASAGRHFPCFRYSRRLDSPGQPHQKYVCAYGSIDRAPKAARRGTFPCQDGITERRLPPSRSPPGVILTLQPLCSIHPHPR